MHLNIKHIQHVGIPVTNLSNSIAFYESLGFDKVMDANFKHNNQNGTVAMMQLHSIIMELYQMPEQELIEIRKRSNGHIDHIAFDVDDIYATFSILKNNGFKIDEDAPVQLQFWENGCKYFNLIGPDGERLEFNQIL